MADYNEQWKWERTDLECYNPKTQKYDTPSRSAWLISPNGKRWEIMNVSDEEMNRIVLCVNACAGMSDEEVEGIALAQDDLKCLDLLRALQLKPTYNALKAQLDEAVSLMSEVHEFLHFGVNPIHERKYKFMKLINAMVTKHKEDK